MHVTPCECEGPGWCERHKCYKTRLLFQMCRRLPTYFTSWEEGRGLGQRESLRAAPIPRGSCRYRGSLLRTEPCTSCGGKTQIKIFACTVHRECTFARQVTGVALCAGCPDYEPSDASLANG